MTDRILTKYLEVIVKDSLPISSFRPGDRVLLPTEIHQLEKNRVIKQDIVVTVANGNHITTVNGLAQIDYWLPPNNAILVITEDKRILAIPQDIQAILVG